MRVLVTWSSKRGGTEGIGRIIGETLNAHGFEVVATPAHKVGRLDGFDAVIAGGALYAGRWPANVRRLLQHNVRRLRELPVWLFSSGPLDDSADREALAATQQVAVLAELIGARGHATFGGRLTPDARGFPASVMAKKHSGDWRNPALIRAWADELAAELPTARPGAHVDHPARSLTRLIAHGALGWLLSTVVLEALLWVAGRGTAIAVHALAAPLIFTLVAVRYFRERGARDALPTALAWAALVVVLDLAIPGGVVHHNLVLFTSLGATWLPLALLFLAVWMTGEVKSIEVPGNSPATATAKEVVHTS